jgi:hypothetical protein
MEAKTEDLIGHDREKTKSGVERPVQPNRLTVAGNIRLLKCSFPPPEGDFITSLTEGFRVSVSSGGHCERGVVKNIDVVGKPSGVVVTIQDNPASDITVGISIGRDDFEYARLKRR